MTRRMALPSTAPAAPASELAVHIPTVDLLKRFGSDGWYWFHPPNGELRDKRHVAKLSAMGVVAGVPDLVLLDPSGRFHAIEFKSRLGRLTAEQQVFRDWCERAGVPHQIVRTIDEAVEVLSRWGALRVRIGL